MKTITRIRGAIAAILTITGLLLVHNAIRSQSLTARPLGVFTLGQAFATGCPGGFTCWNFTDSCPNVAQTIPARSPLRYRLSGLPAWLSSFPVQGPRLVARNVSSGAA